LPALVEINRMYRHRAFEMVTVAVNPPAEKAEVEKHLKKVQCSATNLLLTNTRKEGDFDLPSTVLYNSEGRVLYKASGKIDPVQLKKAIVNTLGRFIDKKK